MHRPLGSAKARNSVKTCGSGIPRSGHSGRSAAKTGCAASRTAFSFRLGRKTSDVAPMPAQQYAWIFASMSATSSGK